MDVLLGVHDQGSGDHLPCIAFVQVNSKGDVGTQIRPRYVFRYKAGIREPSDPMLFLRQMVRQKLDTCH